MTRNRILGVLLLALITALLWRQVDQRSGPNPPLPISVDELDPDVAQLVKDGAAHVQAKKADLQRWIQLGKIYEANAMHGLAAESYKHVLDRDPDQGRVWFRYAICREREGDLDQAIAAMDRVIKLEPKFAAARWRQAMWLVDVGDTDQAIQRADEAIELEPNDPSCWFAKARVLLAQRENQAAIDLIRSHRLEQNANGNYANFLLGTAYRQMGDLDQAAPYLAMSREFRPNWRDEWSAELSKYHTGLSKQRGVASNMVRAGRFEEAIPLLEQVVAAEPTDPRSLNLLGFSLMETGQFERSLEVFEQSIAANPSHFASHVNFAAATAAALATGQADAEQGLQRAEEAISLRPDSAGAHEMRARLLVHLGRLEPSIESFDRAYQLDSREPTGAIAAAQVESQLGRVDVAEARLKKLMESNPQHASVLVHLAAVKLKRGDGAAARGLAERAMTVDICTAADRQTATAILDQTKTSAPHSLNPPAP